MAIYRIGSKPDAQRYRRGLSGAHICVWNACRHVCKNVYGHVCMDICMHMCVDMCVDLCVDICVWTCVYGQVCNVCRHVYV